MKLRGIKWLITNKIGVVLYGRAGSTQVSARNEARMMIEIGVPCWSDSDCAHRCLDFQDGNCDHKMRFCNCF